MAGRVDGGEVRTQYGCYGCEPANFEVERCNGVDCAAADDDILLAIVGYGQGIEGIGEVDGLTYGL